LYRLVCSNGLVIADTEFSNVAIRHMGYTFEALREQVLAMINTLPNLVQKINTFRITELSEIQIEEFATKAVALRWKGKKTSVELVELVAAERNQDKGSNLWTVFNRIQEKLVNGGLSYNNGKKTRKVRALKNFTADMQFNGELWQLAEEYIN
jgi:hypothetical protein